ncbi:hypothetical protein BECAL_01390 [Bellilinea caldifistulae]|uniref:Uncharacterized protein n=1 Tax=Bellilinea caldifistulae TaxID=360411 RepID=A0A0P6WMR8_9CHLR|nr:hypothetical protein [Bellilinea caldifistulae]KPL71231.1 hypothetical protein AC812_16370 [Bellilinea caldifistulae]GAP10227.1 hypothetical protein BECAL_01390 [Bellilinea caldifistulae]
MEKFSSAFSFQHRFRFINSFQLQFPVFMNLPYAGTINLNEITFGLCGGMCFAALDYFHANQLPPPFQTPQEIDPQLFGFLCDRQLDSLKVFTVLKFMEWMIIDEKQIVTRIKRYEIPKMKRLLQKGEPAVLGLVRVRGVQSPTQNHQVLATGYELDPAFEQISISLYDPNHPHLNPVIRFFMGKNATAPLFIQSTGEPLFGFFVIPYRFQKPPQI